MCRRATQVNITPAESRGFDFLPVIFLPYVFCRVFRLVSFDA